MILRTHFPATYGLPWRDKLAVIVPQLGSDDCWPASGCSIDKDGYARVRSSDTDEVLVHRLAVIADGRDIPPGYEVDHVADRCSRRDCANPSHLEVVTGTENRQRARHVQAPEKLPNHCENGHEFTRENTYYHLSGRRCRTCNLAAQMRYKGRKSALQEIKQR